jgi:hypothetical protein
MVLGASVTPEKVCNLIRRLSSDSDGEIVATVYALRRVADVHAIADQLSNGGLDEAEAKRIYDAGYAAGVRDTESRQPATANSFTNTVVDWTDVVLFLQREKHRLAGNHHKFIDDMAERAGSWGYQPTLKQHQYLHGLFGKLGGKIT